ncbi:hydrogenase small subunit [uncultured Helicobacter sp.]|uniref:hydrogenase small subunit n=1 Tax=uncultured Helicobacter sp. TaxID=175537 RepID=UPI002603D825|nr:hydrogenase small subunit [uncultured Helicobacter sp.]
MDKTQMLERLEQRLSEIQSQYKESRYIVNKEWIGQICTLIGIPKECIELCVQILSLKPPTRLIWLHMAECTGCSESFLRLDKPGVESLLLEYISLEYHETIMGAVGFGAKKSLHDTLDEDFILVIEGGVSLDENAYFMTSGADSITGEMESKEVASKAKAIFAVGTCSSFGGVQAALPNPTSSVGIDTFLSQKVVNIPGCPPSEANIIGSLIYFILFDELPELDNFNRPLWSYGKNLHDMCERKAKFESGDFVESFDDPHLQDGYCLYKVGCKGPYVANNCPKVKFNAKTSWPVRAGHGCIACSEPNFWDSFGRIEEPLNNVNAYITTRKTLSHLPHIHNIDDETDSNTLILEWQSNAPTKIYIQTTDSAIPQNLLDCSFQAHFPTLLAHLSGKNKLGARLVENYSKWRTARNLADICQITESNPLELSQNLSDILPLIAQMFGKAHSTFDMLHIAQSYLFPHISKLDMKLSGTQMCQIDIDKSLRLPLCYLLGGLEIEGVAYGAVSSMCEILSAALTTLAKAHNIGQVAFKGDMAHHILIQDRFHTYLPQWLEVV